MQAEVGDYDPESVDVDGIPSYIKEMEFVPGQVCLNSFTLYVLTNFNDRKHGTAKPKFTGLHGGR